jgi:hypothetical protein
MTDSHAPEDDTRTPVVDEDDVKARERDKLDIGDSHPEDRDIRPKPTRQADGLDVGDSHPEKRDTESRT